MLADLSYFHIVYLSTERPLREKATKTILSTYFPDSTRSRKVDSESERPIMLIPA